MLSKNIKYILPLIFIAATTLYYQPLILGGKVLAQHDIVQFRGGASEIFDFREEFNEEPLWTNSMFGGMPAYLVSTLHYGEIYRWPKKMVNKLFPSGSSSMFIGFLSFYVLMLILGVNPYVATIGALAFGLTSFSIISSDAGHNTKVFAMNLMPLMLAGLILITKEKYWKGFALSAFAAATMIGSGHFQIVYYTLLVAIILYSVSIYPLIQKKDWRRIMIISALFASSGLIGLGSNLGKIMTVREYSKYSNRSRSELANDKVQTKEKDRDYAFAWSYGIGESLTFFVPNYQGGGSTSEYPYKSMETYKMLKGGYGKKTAETYVRSLMYWGDQPSTAGPVYFGIIVLFLFLIGLRHIDHRLKYVILSSALLGLVLAWGKNFGLINNLMFDYFPGYNIFRTPSMALSITGFMVALGATLFLDKIIRKKEDSGFLMDKTSWYWVGGFFGVFVLIFLLSQGFSYTGGGQDQSLAQNSPQLLDAMVSDRADLLSKDLFRSFVFVLAAVAVLFMYINGRIGSSTSLVLIGGLVVIDLWAIDKRYLNSDTFVKEKLEQQYPKTSADQQILADPDPNFRVLNLSVSTFNDATTSYWHKSIGGYHGTKMRRYQDLIEEHISRGNQNVLNMLNTKYVIPQDASQGAQRNPGALGNAWFVEKIRKVPGPNEEMEALASFDPTVEAILDESKFSVSKTEFSKSANSKIALDSYKANELIYSSDNESDGFAVFSEVFYPKGWKVSLDGNPVEMVRVNWVLRGLEIPAGQHKIEFKFEPSSYEVGNKISLASSLLIYLLVGAAIFLGYKKENNNENEDPSTSTAS